MVFSYEEDSRVTENKKEKQSTGGKHLSKPEKAHMPPVSYCGVKWWLCAASFLKFNVQPSAGVLMFLILDLMLALRLFIIKMLFIVYDTYFYDQDTR